MTDQVTLSPEAQGLVKDIQMLVHGHQLEDVHGALVNIYTKMILMCTKTQRDAKVLANKMTDDIKGAVVANAAKMKPEKSAIIIPETSGKAN